MPTTTMPAGGGVQSGNLWYTNAEWQAKQAAPAGSIQGGTGLDGKSIVRGLLNQFNLQGIDLDAAYNAWVTSGGPQGNTTYFTNTYLPSTPQFQAVYPAFAKLQQEGKGISVADYQSYNATLNQFAQQYGVPQGFFTPDRVAQALLSGQSTAEIQAGLNRAAQTLADPDVQAWMNAHPSDGGLGGHQLTPGEIYAQATDPAVSEQAAQDRFTQAQIGGAALRQGQSIDGQTAAQLQQAGVTQAQASSGFNAIGQQAQLYGALPGNAGEKNLDQATAIGAQFGTDPQDALAVQQRAAQRKATFAQGGSLATGAGGYAGAGTSNAA